jgi:hypothetical protein
MRAMNYDEFTRQLGKAGLNARQFADLIRMNPNSVTNCSKKGEVPAHLAVIVSLMGEMAEHRIDFKAVLAKVEIEPKKPRGGAAKGRFGGSRQEDFFVPSGDKVERSK